jgi:hypothetical protein
VESGRSGFAVWLVWSVWLLGRDRQNRPLHPLTFPNAPPDLMLADHANDIYVHSQLSERIAPLVGKLLGFLALNDKTESMKDLKVEVLGHDLALGFYRWPTAWRITWTGSKGPVTLSLAVFDRNGIANWIIGGFSMGILHGEMDDTGTKYPIYGLAELIM